MKRNWGTISQDGFSFYLSSKGEILGDIVDNAGLILTIMEGICIITLCTH